MTKTGRRKKCAYQPTLLCHVLATRGIAQKVVALTINRSASNTCGKLRGLIWLNDSEAEVIAGIAGQRVSYLFRRLRVRGRSRFVARAFVQIGAE